MTKLLTTFAALALPTLSFTTMAIFHNLQTTAHVDSKNGHHPNGVIALTSFQGGGIWIEEPAGPVSRTVNGKSVAGRVHDLTSPLIFNAFQKVHSTEPWSGERVVLVCFSVASLANVSAHDVATLQNLRFPLLQELPPQESVHSRTDQPPKTESPWAFEVFSGQASLSRALAKQGFKTIGFDTSLEVSNAPTARLDLTKTSHQDLFWEIYERSNPNTFIWARPVAQLPKPVNDHCPAPSSCEGLLQNLCEANACCWAFHPSKLVARPAAESEQPTFCTNSLCASSCAA